MPRARAVQVERVLLQRGAAERVPALLVLVARRQRVLAVARPQLAQVGVRPVQGVMLRLAQVAKLAPPVQLACPRRPDRSILP
jgi:hypothetical protein